MKTFLVNILIFLLLVLAFDVTTIWLLPDEYTSRFPEYREYRRSPPPTVGGRARYPKNYFVKHQIQGFDIGKNKSGYHWVNGITYPIWSNSIGCFDNEYARYDRYVYFAGDSFTWGYAPFDDKFGTILERMTETRILKCGVTHTGQRHQYQKFIEIMGQIHTLPEAIFVFSVSNDVANDYAHPHSTVIDGWLVDRISIDERDELVNHTSQYLKQKMAKNLNQLKQIRNNSKISILQRVKNGLKIYSLSANLINYAKKSIIIMVSFPEIRNFYKLPRQLNGKHWYSDNPNARANKSALLAFNQFSTENDISLVVVLIPPKRHAVNTNYYEEIREFLDENNIRYIDLAIKFHERGLDSDDLYWIYDGHLSPLGNEVVAEILMEEFPRTFKHNPHLTNTNGQND